MAKKELENEQNELDVLTRSEEIEYNLKEIKKAIENLNEQRKEFAKQIKQYNKEREKMAELIQSSMGDSEDAESLFDDEVDTDTLFDDDFDTFLYDKEFINKIKVALYELGMVIENTDNKLRIKKALHKVNSIIYDYENQDLDDEESEEE